MIIGFSGKKQSGKTTAGNFITSVYMANMDICKSITLNDQGHIEVSDILGNTAYKGVWDISNLNKKDYILNRLAEKLYPTVRLYNFADVLKQDICMNILGLTYEQCYGSDDEKNKLTDMVWENNRLSSRDTMQFIGTDVFRKLKPDIWVDATISKISRDKPKLAIITDCRFPNEVESIKKAGGKVIRLTRAPFDSDHVSENILNEENYDWSNFDHIIDNKDMSIYEQCVEIEKILIEVLSL
jgi:hypothetical protein